MKMTIKYLFSFLFVLGIAVANTGQTPMTYVTWSSDPVPEATLNSSPLLLEPSQVIEFTATDVVDLDTKTTVTIGENCYSSEELIPDSTGNSFWIITEVGLNTTYTSAIANHQSGAWPWESGAGDYGSNSGVVGSFVVFDGRDESDPRRDMVGAGGRAATKLVPDTITTSLDGHWCIGNNHAGHCFEHTAYNSDFPAFSFEGGEISETIEWVLCPDEICNDQTDSLIVGIKNVGDDTWTLGADNSFHITDCHVAGVNLSQLLEIAGEVTLAQTYSIESWGWPAKNPNHAIGAVKGFFGYFSAFQTIVFRLEGSQVRVIKNGLTCGSPLGDHCSS